MLIYQRVSSLHFWSYQNIRDGFTPWISMPSSHPTISRGGRYDGLLASYMLDITVEVVKMKDSEAAGQEMIGETGGNTGDVGWISINGNGLKSDYYSYPLVNVYSELENHHAILIGKSTISMIMFNSKLLVYQRLLFATEMLISESIGALSWRWSSRRNGDWTELF